MIIFKRFKKIIILLIILIPLCSFLDVLFFYRTLPTIQLFGRFLFYCMIEAMMFIFGLDLGYSWKRKKPEK